MPSLGLNSSPDRWSAALRAHGTARIRPGCTQVGQLRPNSGSRRVQVEQIGASMVPPADSPDLAAADAAGGPLLTGSATLPAGGCGDPQGACLPEISQVRTGQGRQVAQSGPSVGGADVDNRSAAAGCGPGLLVGWIGVR